jgi:site-specific recombinase XerD
MLCMTQPPVAARQTSLTTIGSRSTSQIAPALIGRSDEKTKKRFWEFFTATIRNKNTRQAYYRAVKKFFDWCEVRGVTELHQFEPIIVAAFIEEETALCAPPTVKQELAAIRMLFDWLVMGQVLPTNPASSVRGPAYSINVGKTHVLAREDARRLLESIPICKKSQDENGVFQPDLIGLRDRALIGLMVYSFARVSAVLAMEVRDYTQKGKRFWIRLHEKGGKFHQVPVHHSAEEYLDAYLAAAGLADEKKTALWRSAQGRGGALTNRRMSRVDAFRMIKRRARAAGLSEEVCCHTFRATGITAFLQNGGTIENAQQIAAHSSPRTTKLYDRRSDEISLNEIERIIL